MVVLDGSADRLDALLTELTDPRVWFMIGDAEVIPLPDGSADEVLGAPASPRSPGFRGDGRASGPRARRRDGALGRGGSRRARAARRRGGHRRPQGRERRASSVGSTASGSSSRARVCPARTRSSSRRASRASRSGARGRARLPVAAAACGSSASRARTGRRRPCGCSGRCSPRPVATSRWPGTSTHRSARSRTPSSPARGSSAS